MGKREKEGEFGEVRGDPQQRSHTMVGKADVRLKALPRGLNTATPNQGYHEQLAEAEAIPTRCWAHHTALKGNPEVFNTSHPWTLCSWAQLLHTLTHGVRRLQCRAQQERAAEQQLHRSPGTQQAGSSAELQEPMLHKAVVSAKRSHLCLHA